MPNFKVYFFQTARGTLPVKEFMEAQNDEVYTKILRSIKLLREGGPFLKPPDVKKIDRNLYELRIRGQEAVRIFYTMRLKRKHRKFQGKNSRQLLTEWRN